MIQVWQEMVHSFFCALSVSLNENYAIYYSCFKQGGRSCAGARVAPADSSLDSDENFKPEHTLFCRELRFVAIYALFGDLWAKKVSFWVKNSVFWARSTLLHGIYCIFY